MSAGFHLRLSYSQRSRTDAHEIGFDLGICSEFLLGSIENRCEKDVEQCRCQNTTLTKTLVNLKPSRHPSPVQLYAHSHPIVELTHNIDQHRRHPKSSENNPEKEAVDRDVRFLEVHETGI